MSTQRARLSVLIFLFFVMTIFVCQIAWSQATDYAYLKGFTTPEMTLWPANENGRGLAVNDRTGSSYKGYIYYCCGESSTTITTGPNAGKQTIEIIQPTGNLLKIIALPDGNNIPHHCFVDPVNDYVYVTSLLNRQVYRMAPDGSSITPVLNTGQDGDSDSTRRPRAIYVTGSGSTRTMYIAAETEGQVWTSADSGLHWTQTLTLNVGDVSGIYSITVDSAGNIYLLNRGSDLNASLFKFNSNGNRSFVYWQPANIPDDTLVGNMIVQDVKYLNNSTIGESLLVSASYGSSATGAVRIYRYTTDGKYRGVFGNTVSEDLNLNSMTANNTNGLVYMSVSSPYLFINASPTPVGIPEIMQVELVPVKTGNITGKVKLSNGQAAAGATVYTSNGDKVVADAQGNYTISSLLPGTAKVMAWVLGYKPSNRRDTETPISPVEVTVEGGKTVPAPDITIQVGDVWDQTPVLTIYKVSPGVGAPTIDGTVDTTTEWKYAAAMPPFVTDGKTTAASVQTTVRASYDDQYLYVAYDCTEPSSSVVYTDDLSDDFGVWSGSDAEIYVDAAHTHQYDKTENDGLYPRVHQFGGNPYSIAEGGWFDLNWNPWNDPSEWDAAGAEFVGSMGSGHWYLEGKIPFSAFSEIGGVAPSVGQVMGIIFGRQRMFEINNWDTADLSLSAYVKGGMWADCKQMNDMVFAGEAYGKISGKVVYNDDTPVPNAVVLTSTGAKAITDAQGVYTLDKVSVGGIQLMASIPGWKATHNHETGGDDSLPLTVTVNKDQTSSANNLVISKLASDQAPAYTVFKRKDTDAVPTIDGVINTSEWQDSLALTRFFEHGTGGGAALVQTKAWLTYTKDAMYAAFECMQDNLASISPESLGSGNDPAEYPWNSEDVSIFLDPLNYHRGPMNSWAAYQVSVNSKPAPNTGFTDLNWDTWNLDWDAKDMKVAATRGTDRWYVEIKWPFSGLKEFNEVCPADGSLVGLLFARGSMSKGSWVSTGMAMNGFKEARTWNTIVFAGLHPSTTTYSTPTGFVKGGRWNCISLPATPVNGLAPMVMKGVDVPLASLQYWKNDAAAGGWQSYGSSFGWNEDVPMKLGTAYWFIEPKRTTNTEISFEGTEYATDFELTIPAHASAPFWVMLGTPFPRSVLASNMQFKNIGKAGDNWYSWKDAYDVSRRFVESKAQGWNAATSSFFDVSIPEWNAPTQQLDPWFGYWILIRDNHEIKIKFPKPPL